MAYATESVRISEGGRIVLPAKVRRALDLKCGDELLVFVEGEEVRLMTVDAGLRKVQRIAATHVLGTTSMADELIAERRLEAAREEKD